jgi:hypothetical protein
MVSENVPRHEYIEAPALDIVRSDSLHRRATIVQYI